MILEFALALFAHSVRLEINNPLHQAVVGSYTAEDSLSGGLWLCTRTFPTH